MYHKTSTVYHKRLVDSQGDFVDVVTKSCGPGKLRTEIIGNIYSMTELDLNTNKPNLEQDTKMINRHVNTINALLVQSYDCEDTITETEFLVIIFGQTLKNWIPMPRPAIPVIVFD